MLLVKSYTYMDVVLGDRSSIGDNLLIQYDAMELNVVDDDDVQWFQCC